MKWASVVVISLYSLWIGTSCGWSQTEPWWLQKWPIDFLRSWAFSDITGRIDLSDYSKTDTDYAAHSRQLLEPGMPLSESNHLPIELSGGYYAIYTLKKDSHGTLEGRIYAPGGQLAEVAIIPKNGYYPRKVLCYAAFPPFAPVGKHPGDLIEVGVVAAPEQAPVTFNPDGSLKQGSDCSSTMVVASP